MLVSIIYFSWCLFCYRSRIHKLLKQGVSRASDCDSTLRVKFPHISSCHGGHEPLFTINPYRLVQTYNTWRVKRRLSTDATIVKPLSACRSGLNVFCRSNSRYEKARCGRNIAYIFINLFTSLADLLLSYTGKCTLRERIKYFRERYIR